MEKDSTILIWINDTMYWELDLVPIMNEFQEQVNRCALVDSSAQKELHAVCFDSTHFIPIFKSRSKEGMKELASKLKEITDTLGIRVTPRSQMPEDKVAKPVEKVVKKVVKKDGFDEKE
jgi:hypothetical protein